MPVAAQRIWVNAFNAAWKTHPDDEAYCNAAAYTAVKNAGYKERDDRWVKESAMKDKKSYWTEPGEVDDVTVLEEAAGETAKTPKLTVTVIREGFSANSYPLFNTRRHKYQLYYTKQAVADIANLIEGQPVYVGAPDIHVGYRSLRDNVVGVFENSRVIKEADGRSTCKAEVAVYPDQKWIVDRARVSKRAFGPSIEGDPKEIHRGTVEGRDAAIVESVKAIYGALLVVNPAAGGGLDGILESKQPDKRGKKMELSELTESERAELTESVRKEVLAEFDVKAKDEKIKALEESMKKLEDERKEHEAQLNEAKSRELLDAAFPKEMPQVSKDRLYEALRGETEPAKIQEAVKKEAEYVAAVTGGTKVTGAPAKPETEQGTLNEAKNIAKEAFGLNGEREDKKSVEVK